MNEGSAPIALILAGFTFGFVSWRVAASSASWTVRLLVGVMLFVLIALPIFVLSGYVGASLYWYRPGYRAAAVREVIELLFNEFNKLALFHVAATAGVWIAFKAGKVRLRRSGPTAGLLLAIFIANGEVKAAPVSLTTADRQTLHALLTMDTMRFVGGVNQIPEPVCWCAVRVERAMISPWVEKALVAVEDRRYYGHYGFDPRGFVRALVNTALRRRLEGGSTLTQQAVKNLLLTDARNMQRKIDEVSLSAHVESLFTKEEILTFYLNGVAFGWSDGMPIVGIEQAARHFTGRPASQLSLRDAAMLIGMLKAPATYNPILRQEAARNRTDIVLRLMLEQAVITEAQFQQAMRPQRARGAMQMARPYVRAFLDYAIANVRADYPEWRPQRVDRIMITINLAAQAAAQRRLATLTLPPAMADVELSYVRAGADGAVAVMLAQRRPNTATMNYATARRQPASVYKPFVYIQGLHEKRLAPSAALTQALARSDNALPISVLRAIGPQKNIDFMRRLGVTAPLRPDLSLALGTSEMSLVELVGAYSALRARGRATRTHAYTHMVYGGLIFVRPLPAGEAFIAPHHVQVMEQMLRAVVINGTGRAAQGVPQAAGKTGTSDEHRNALFLGLRGSIVSGVPMAPFFDAV